ncbi:DUF6366 family protein [Bacillus cytotoxicus]|uniref:DUF6366 family protein n=1 Tax=Bacillus cytotoxicus TaxID=580165 RepID=A0ACC6A8G7_9BACI|nr:DUF6366 family protein [Bacillus cytotoxicus]
MSEDKETPERRRESLRQEELKKPTGNMNDAFDRAETGNFADLLGSLGWKGIGVFILIIIIGFMVVSIFLK